MPVHLRPSTPDGNIIRNNRTGADGCPPPDWRRTAESARRCRTSTPSPKRTPPDAAPSGLQNASSPISRSWPECNAPVHHRVTADLGGSRSRSSPRRGERPANLRGVEIQSTVGWTNVANRCRKPFTQSSATFTAFPGSQSHRERINRARVVLEPIIVTEHRSRLSNSPIFDRSLTTKPKNSYVVFAVDVTDEPRLPVQTRRLRSRQSVSSHSSSRPVPSPEPMNSGIVAWPSALMPFPVTTCQAVIARIFTSSQKLTLSTYHTSSSNFSSQLSALRPLTCAQPGDPRLHVVTPSLLHSVTLEILHQQRPRPHQAHVALCSTLKSSGSSSRLVRRSNRPKRVRRTSSGSNCPFSVSSLRHGPELEEREWPALKAWPHAGGRKPVSRAANGPTAQARRGQAPE